MDNSHAPFPLPPLGQEAFFIGYLSGCLEQDGQITPENWVQALRATGYFQREAEIDITNRQSF